MQKRRQIEGIAGRLRRGKGKLWGEEVIYNS